MVLHEKWVKAKTDGLALYGRAVSEKLTAAIQTANETANQERTNGLAFNKHFGPALDLYEKTKEKGSAEALAKAKKQFEKFENVLHDSDMRSAFEKYLAKVHAMENYDFAVKGFLKKPADAYEEYINPLTADQAITISSDLSKKFELLSKAKDDKRMDREGRELLKKCREQIVKDIQLGPLHDFQATREFADIAKANDPALAPLKKNVQEIAKGYAKLVLDKAAAIKGAKGVKSDFRTPLLKALEEIVHAL